MSNGGHRSIKPDARFRADFIKDLSYASHLLNPAPTVQGEIATRRDHSRRKRWNIPPQRLHIQIVRHQQRSEEHTSELQSLMRISYAVFCLKNKKPTQKINTILKIIYKKITTEQ